MASISDRVGDLGEYLREQRESAKLSVRQLASLAGVSNPYLSQVERGLRKPSAEVLQQIARGLAISAEALYVRAGILDEDHRLGVDAAVHADSNLNDRQKRVILDIYASFRAENARAAGEPASTKRRGSSTRSRKSASADPASNGAAAADAAPTPAHAPEPTPPQPAPATDAQGIPDQNTLDAAPSARR